MLGVIVVGTDGSDGANRAVTEAIDLAKAAGAKIHFVTAYPDPSRIVEQIRSTARSEHPDLRAVAESVLARAAETAKAAGLEYDTHVGADNPADAIIEVAREQQADLVIVGERGVRGPSRFLVGSVSTKVVHHAPCSVMVVRER